VRKKMSPMAQAEFDAAFASLTPAEVEAVLRNSKSDQDTDIIVQIAKRHIRHPQWQAALNIRNHQWEAALTPTAAAGALRTHHGGPAYNPYGAGALWTQHGYRPTPGYAAGALYPPPHPAAFYGR